MLEPIISAVTVESLSQVFGAGFVLTLAFYLAGVPVGAALSLIRKA